MDWTKIKTEKYVSIDEVLNELDQGNIDMCDAKEVINETINHIIKQAGMDLKVMTATRNFIDAIKNI